jgi:hypothetical protein
MAEKEPTSYKDPLYADLAAKTEQKLGLPSGLVRSIIMDGERTNADKVSPAGARGVGQFIPATRNAMIDKYGVDPWLNADTAVESIGLLLKENLNRAGGNVEQAVRQYHGGLDPKNWGPVNNAYWGRVSRGFDRSRTDAMGKDFASWMAANPAVSNVPSMQAQASASSSPSEQTQDALSAGFGAWLKGQAATPQDIPVEPGADTSITPEKERTIGDSLLGAAEAGLSLATGMTGGALGTLTGTAGGVVRAMQDGTFGTPEGLRDIQSAAEQGAQNLTYAPRTPAGQHMAGAVGNAVAATLPIAPLTGELSALARAGAAAKPSFAAAAPVAKGVATEAAQTVRNASRAAQERVSQAMGRAPQEAPTPGTGANLSAAGVDMETLRQARAAELPVPIELTKGQASRDMGQLRFEQETAKQGDLGAPLRERQYNQNRQLAQNLDALIDNTGAEAPTLLETGRTVTDALRKDAAKAKTEYKVKYKQAEKAGEMEAPVSMEPLVNFLKENESFDSPGLAPVLSLAQRELKRLGGAVDSADGLIPGDISLKNAELLRRQIGNAIGSDLGNATNMRMGIQLKELIDGATEGVGGQLYKEARKARQRYGQLYENNDIVSQLLETKRGTADRQVALEDVFRKTILAGSRDDLSMLRRTLQVPKSPEGLQAWKELQGATVRHILEEATKGVGVDGAGNPIVSPAKLHQAVQTLEKGNKLDFILGKRRAEMVRVIDDVSRDILTTPPGAVNHSNTSAALIAWLTEAGLTGAATGLPVPVMTSLRLISKQLKDRKLRLRVQEALGRANREKSSNNHDKK